MRLRERIKRCEVRYGGMRPTWTFSVRYISISPKKHLVNSLTTDIIPLMQRIHSKIRALTQSSSVQDVVGNWIVVVVDRPKIAEGQGPVRIRAFQDAPHTTCCQSNDGRLAESWSEWYLKMSTSFSRSSSASSPNAWRSFNSAPCGVKSTWAYAYGCALSVEAPLV
jgi:hypothetical protein